MIGGRALAPVLARRWSVRRTVDALLDRSRPTWRDATVLVAPLAIDAAAARRWLPPPLRAEPAATVFVADYPDTSFGIAYREAGLLLHATLRGRPVAHCAWIVVDDDAALTLGRELLGFPKKLAAISLACDVAAGGALRAAVVRRGVELIRIDGALAGELPAARAFGRPIVNVRGLPGVVPAALWRMDVPERLHRARAAGVVVTIAGSAWDPLDELAAAPAGAARALHVDLGVPPLGARIPRGVVPVGVVSPRWLVERLPLRTL